jgi:hypothetical protein
MQQTRGSKSGAARVIVRLDGVPGAFCSHLKTSRLRLDQENQHANGVAEVSVKVPDELEGILPSIPSIFFAIGDEIAASEKVCAG